MSFFLMFLSLFATRRLTQQVVADFAVDTLACVAVFTLQLHPVSYTHLTLPTIYSV